ncbi:MAG: hypothetical protein EB829_01565 [Nitrosopumilus sp. H8]|nr:MAG: hypothetical protein EB829_01565 [Nitrosopumilus sp. H8]
MIDISNLDAVIIGVVFTLIITAVIYRVGQKNTNAIRKQLIKTMLQWLDECAVVCKQNIESSQESPLEWIKEWHDEINNLFKTYSYVLKFDFVREIRGILKIIGQNICVMPSETERIMILGEHIESMKAIIEKAYPREYLQHVLMKEQR